MTEASKNRMEEKKQQDMFTFKHGVWPETISEQVRLRDADFACLGFKAGFEAGYIKGMLDPDAQKELLEEAKESLESLVHGIMDLGGTSAQQFKAKQKLLDKMSDAILTLNKLRAVKMLGDVE